MRRIGHLETTEDPAIAMTELTREQPSRVVKPNLRNFPIEFKHPHYSELCNQNVILSLEGYDAYPYENGGTEEQRGGLHYGTALTACAIVAGNAWDGYFSQERDGLRLELRHDQLLTGCAYYFHVPDTSGVSSLYPVCPSFEHWVFPHHDFPAPWIGPAGSTSASSVPSARSSVTAAVLQRDSTCLITKQRDAMEKAHLCPSNEQSWFRMNGMSKYNVNKMLPPDFTVDDISNAIALRCDIHTVFDNRTFAIVPKEGSWVPHFFRATHDLGSLYHNMRLQLDRGISVQHLLARFAWTIFPLVREFLQRGGSRTVKFRATTENGHKEMTETMDADAINAKFFSNRARSQSPKKRKAADETHENQENDGGRDAKRRRYSDSGGSLTEDISGSKTLGTLQGDEEIDETDRAWLWVRNPCSIGSEGDQAWEAGEDEFDNYIQRLRRKELLKNRPKNLKLYCCDYGRADTLTRKGVPGKREWGGSHLCEECLGGEYLPTAKDLKELCEE